MMFMVITKKGTYFSGKAKGIELTCATMTMLNALYKSGMTKQMLHDIVNVCDKLGLKDITGSDKQ